MTMWRSELVLLGRRQKFTYIPVFCVALLIWCAVSVDAAFAQVTPASQSASQVPAQPLPTNIKGGFSVAAVGDLIIAHSLPENDPKFRAVQKVLGGADVRFGNLEGSLLNPFKLRIWPASETGGDYIYALPKVASDIKDFGFNLLSHANNHDTDWGIKGMEVTDRVLDRAGLVFAGSGLDLASARAPKYLTLPRGRVALVAMTSSFTGMEPAAAPYSGISGRPGVSTLHTTVYHLVTQQQMESLRQIYNTQPDKPEHPATEDTNQLRLFGTVYRIGSADGLTSEMNPQNLTEILRAIREGKEQSDFEIVYIHAHNPGNWSEKPATFLPKLAHDAIDAGADEFISSGPHRLRGIEIYKHKPIFYSLGDFIFEVGQLTVPTPESVEQSHTEPAVTTDYEIQERHLANWFNAPVWYHSVVAVSAFNSQGDVTEVKLYPVDLGFNRSPRTTVGIPHLASTKVAQEILHQLQRLSQPYGTDIEIQGNVGVIQVAG